MTLCGDDPNSIFKIVFTSKTRNKSQEKANKQNLILR